MTLVADCKLPPATLSTALLLLLFPIGTRTGWAGLDLGWLAFAERERNFIFLAGSSSGGKINTEQRETKGI